MAVLAEPWHFSQVGAVVFTPQFWIPRPWQALFEQVP
jgi:hypothetical protein